MQSLTGQFKAFVKSKPRDEAYNYLDNCGCVCGQFCDATGIDWQGDDAALDARLGIERDFAGVLASRPWTFGALADRLERLGA